MSVMLVTSLGPIVIDLHTDRCRDTCYNFLKLCKINYYNNCIFRTIEKDFIAQTGDPTGTGSGGDSIYKFLYGDRFRFFRDEIRSDLKHTKTGTVVMASAGENLNASQFYITLCDHIDYLDGNKSVFGKVAEGIKYVKMMNEAYADDKNRPYKDIRILNTYVLYDPFKDPPGINELVVNERERRDEVEDEVRIDDDEVVGEKEAHSRTVVLECIGDLPYTEIMPPDNVLFVCKLNSETQDEDLKMIFSQCGTVKSCEIVRDYKTGKSLRYGFIEFDDRKACERAYEKMDNTLIDDKRIYVDFSQSVSRVNHVGKGCLKCGSLNHVVKECNVNPNAKQYSKHVMRNDCLSRKCGYDNDEVTPQRKKKPRHGDMRGRSSRGGKGADAPLRVYRV